MATSTSRPEFDPATQPLRPDRTLGELFAEMTSDVGTLFRKEIELAKLEAKEEGARLGKGVGMFGGAGLAGWLALVFVSFAAAWLLDQAMNTALAFLIVGVVWAVVALVLMQKGKKQLKEAKGMPKTTETIKEDVQWAKTLKN
jgi:cobalamin biosynthesis protein CobD/CbiB